MILDGIVSWAKGVWNKMINKASIKRALKVDIVTSDAMVSALKLWTQMYENKSSWLKENEVYSLNLAAAISAEISRISTIEMKVKIEGDNRAIYLEEQFKKVTDKIRETVEFGAAKGGIIFKPYVSGDEINVDFIQADQFFPVKFDSNGNIQSCVFVDQRKIGDKYYTRLEFHELKEGGVYVVINKAYKSNSRTTLGNEISLSVIPDWAELSSETILSGIEKPLFAYFRYPLANNIDPNSPLGVSCYSRSTDLIQQADEQWSNLLWEFESGKRALYIDVLAFGKDDSGKPILPNKRLYRTLNQGGAISDEGMWHEWSPSLRQEDLLAGLDAILKKIEFTCGIAYGTLSNPQTVDKTATEIKTSKQRTFTTIVDVQKVVTSTFDNLLYVMDVWATLSNLGGKGKYTATYEFDDSIIVDKDVQWTQELNLVARGIMGNVEFRMRNLGEDEDTAKAQVALATAERQTEQKLFEDENKKDI